MAGIDPTQLKRAKEKINRYRVDPCYFAREEFKTELDPWQIEFLSVFPDPTKRRIAMKACKGVGKTAGLAMAIWNFMLCYGEPGEHPKGVATSITEDNINDNLWPELAKWQGRSAFLTNNFTWTKSRIFANDHPETWFFSKRTWPKSADPSQQANTLAGLHAKYILFVLDESGGIPDSVMSAAEGGLSTDSPGHWTKIVQAGNPTHREGPLYRASTSERHLWHLISITGDPDNPSRSTRQSKEWAREQIQKYGRDNPWVLINVFGEFPETSLNALFSPDLVEASMKKHLREDQYNTAQKRIGCDVARFGDDRTCLFPRQGLAAFTPVIMRGARTNEIAARLTMAKSKWLSELEMIDDSGGWGAGVIDSMIQGGLNPMPVNFSGKAIDPRYHNKRAEMWFNMAEWLKRGGVLPPVMELVPELTAVTYTFQNGKFLIEPKEQIKSRLGFSPDLADALCLTFALPEMPASLPFPYGKENKTNADYDPFADDRV